MITFWDKLIPKRVHLKYKKIFDRKKALINF